jgi:soluble lytic murein transglycosylase-like protein
MRYTKHRRYGFLPKYENSLSADTFVGIITILLFMGLVFHTLAPRASIQSSTATAAPSEAQNWRIKPACPENDVHCLIHQYSHKYGVNTDTAIRIAECESNFDTYARNPNSTASGVYQFVSTTFENYCTGDVFNPHNNIQCFMELYHKHPNWWQCV